MKKKTLKKHREKKNTFPCLFTWEYTKHTPIWNYPNDNDDL